MSDLLNRVRKGLDLCSSGFPCNENECPYWDDLQCIRTIKEDALALINAQQERIRELEAAPIPRLLTLEEAKCTHYTMPIIVEQCQSRCEHLLCAGKVKGGIRLIRANGQGFALHWSSYGPTWRMWSAFPTWEQREAVAWG